MVWSDSIFGSILASPPNYPFSAFFPLTSMYTYSINYYPSINTFVLSALIPSIIVVLGQSLNPNGRPPQTLLSRFGRAIECWRGQDHSVGR